MARRPAEIVQVNLRCREDFRRKVQAAADANGNSLNGEIISRLNRTFTEPVARDFDSMSKDFGRFGDTLHGLNRQADLLGAIDPLLKEIGTLPDDAQTAKVKRAADKVRDVVRFLEIDAAAMLRRTGLPPAM